MGYIGQQPAPKVVTSSDLADDVVTADKIGDTAIGTYVNGRELSLQHPLKNGDMVKIITSKKVSPSMHWLSSTKTGKARSAIRKYWEGRMNKNITNEDKMYSSTIVIDLPHKPGVLGEVSTLIG